MSNFLPEVVTIFSNDFENVNRVGRIVSDNVIETDLTRTDKHGRFSTSKPLSPPPSPRELMMLNNCTLRI